MTDIPFEDPRFIDGVMAALKRYSEADALNQLLPNPHLSSAQIFMALETMASLWRLGLRDLGLPKSAVDDTRKAASALAQKIHEESGRGPEIRAFTNERRNKLAEAQAYMNDEHGDEAKAKADELAALFIARAKGGG